MCHLNLECNYIILIKQTNLKLLMILASKLGDRIQDAVGKAMDPMVNKMDEYKKMGEDYLKGIKEISQNITKDVGAAGEVLMHSDRLDILSTTLGDLSNKFQQSSQQFETDITSTLKGVKDSIVGVEVLRKVQ